jgi:hypothetical protein
VRRPSLSLRRHLLSSDRAGVCHLGRGGRRVGAPTAQLCTTPSLCLCRRLATIGAELRPCRRAPPRPRGVGELQSTTVAWGAPSASVVTLGEVCAPACIDSVGLGRGPSGRFRCRPARARIRGHRVVPRPPVRHDTRHSPTR